MPTVFISHSSVDKQFVRELADFLQQPDATRDIKIEVWLDERELEPGANLALALSRALDADFFLLILSPDACSSHWVETEWTAALTKWNDTGRRPRVLCVLLRECAVPDLLRGSQRFDLRNNHPEGFRQIRHFLLTAQPAPPRHINFLPPRPVPFVGRKAELSLLRRLLQTGGTLVPVVEMGGRGKSSLALEFAHRHQADFAAVYWLPCASENLAAISAELQRQLGLKIDGDLPTVVRELQLHCAARRCLLILDDVRDESPFQLVPGGDACVLITTRRRDLAPLRLLSPLNLPDFTEEDAFALFRTVLGNAAVDAHAAACRTLFTRLGHQPLAVSICAGLIHSDLRYTIAGMAANPPADATALLHEAIQALEPAAHRLLSAMAVCAPEGFFFDLAAEIAGQPELASHEALQQIHRRSLLRILDRDASRYSLHALVRDTAVDPALRPRHLEAVGKRFENWEADWQRCQFLLSDFELALDTALADPADPTLVSRAASLANRGFRLTYRTGRLPQAHDLCRRMAAVAKATNDPGREQAWLGNQALILKAWGRLNEALALHKKEEETCLALGNQEGLQASYGNQALILQAWGRLNEAMALLKKKEEICLALGNQDSLQRCYGNQASMLQDWGRLDEAMALLKKKEEICLALDNQDGLQASYGNQALILRAWGRLDEAMALLKKKEEICLALGNQDGLQASYGNQALILQDWGRLDEALALLKKQEEICLALGDQDGLQASYGNQALILQDWGRLDEALALHKKEEEICLALGIKRDLGYCYWNLGLLERARLNPVAERNHLQAALALFEELKMPRERDAVHAELQETLAAGAG